MTNETESFVFDEFAGFLLVILYVDSIPRTVYFDMVDGRGYQSKDSVVEMCFRLISLSIAEDDVVDFFVG